VPFAFVGAATAGRLFFQQLGQMLGTAIFGAILTSTLTGALVDNLAPITAKLPPEFARQLDPSKLRNGSGGEGTGGEQAAIDEQIAQAIHQRFAAQRTLVTKALAEGDPAATQALLADPQTPGQLRETLQGGQLPASSRQAALMQISAGLDAAEADAAAKGAQIGHEVGDAIKLAFTSSVIQIYRYDILPVLLGMLLMLWVPELPLRKSNQAAAAPVFD
jgi:hypothetical protein